MWQPRRLRKLFGCQKRYTGYSLAGRSVLGEIVPEVLSTALGRSTQTEHTVSPNADRPTPVNNPPFLFFPTEI